MHSTVINGVWKFTWGWVIEAHFSVLKGLIRSFKIWFYFLSWEKFKYIVCGRFIELSGVGVAWGRR